MAARVVNGILRLGVSVALAVFLLAVEMVCLWRALLERLGVRADLVEVAAGARPLRVLAIGTFYHPNWYRAHLIPLAGSEAVGEVRVVSGEAGEPLKGVRWCVAPRWLHRLAGRNVARAMAATWQALQWRPDVLVGYFIFPNALLALLLARLTGGLAVYQMGGGPLEIQNCGADSENPFLRRVLPGLPGLHGLLMRTIGRFDLIVVRGGSARAFCQERFPNVRVQAITAGIDCDRFRPMPEVQKRFDVITVTRLTPLKRVDVTIQAVARVAERRSDVTALIVGDGPEREHLERLSVSLGLAGRLHFVGRRDDVPMVLNESRVFVLSSDSEGFSIAMAEAMACGLPAVVSDVGELGELVRNGHTGRLVPRGDVSAFAKAIEELLSDSAGLARTSTSAAEAARELCAMDAVSGRWTRVLRELTAGTGVPAKVCTATARSEQI